MSYEKQLTDKEWGKFANKDIVQSVINNLRRDTVSPWSEEILRIVEKKNKQESKVLEIGCGTGVSSIYLALHGHDVTALDFSKDSIECVNIVADAVKVRVKTLLCDATKQLPFEDKEYDFAFQAGLLEHFTKEERVSLLKNWKRVSKTMVSMIPNASSLAYRVGKAIMENNGSWEYGRELPQYSLIDEFTLAGYKNIREYTIAERHALEFLPPKHYLRKALEKWIKENPCNDNCGQGYLLITIGENI